MNADVGVITVSGADQTTPCTNGSFAATNNALDPHKWLSAPVECGCVLVRDGSLLQDAFSLVPTFGPNQGKESGTSLGFPSTVSSKPEDFER